MGTSDWKSRRDVRIATKVVLTFGTVVFGFVGLFVLAMMGMGAGYECMNDETSFWCGGGGAVVIFGLLGLLLAGFIWANWLIWRKRKA